MRARQGWWQKRGMGANHMGATILLAIVGVSAAGAQDGQSLSTYWGRGFSGPQARAECDAFLPALVAKTEKAQNSVLSAACVASTFQAGSFVAKMDYFHKYGSEVHTVRFSGLSLSDCHREAQRAGTQEASLGALLDATCNGDGLKLDYFPARRRAIVEKILSRRFDDVSACEQQREEWLTSLPPKELTPIVLVCSAYSQGSSAKKSYWIRGLFGMPNGFTLHSMHFPRSARGSECRADQRVLEDHLAFAKIALIESFCEPGSDTTSVLTAHFFLPLLKSVDTRALSVERSFEGCEALRQRGVELFRSRGFKVLWSSCPSVNGPDGQGYRAWISTTR